MKTIIEELDEVDRLLREIQHSSEEDNTIKLAEDAEMCLDRAIGMIK